MGSREMHQVGRVGDDLTGRLLTAIAEASVGEEDDLAVPLHDVIDVDALERLFQRPDEGVSVTFRYEGQQVDVRRTGVIDVTPSTDVE